MVRGSWHGWLVVFLTLSPGAFAAPATSDILTPKGFTTLRDAATKRKALGIEHYFADRAKLQQNLAKMTVAVLDVGFGDLTPANVEAQLTKGSKIISKYDKGACQGQEFQFAPPRPDQKYAKDPHGMQMAQTWFGVTGFFKNAQKFLLYNANGVPAFTCAVRDIIDNTKPQIVLFSANWETFGNYNGTGPVNDLVAEAVDEGIIWINAAGNYGGLVYNVAADVAKGETGAWLKLGGAENPYFLPFKNTLDDNPVTVKIAWTDDGSDRQLEARLFPAGVIKDVNTKSLAVSKPIPEEMIPGKPRELGASLHAPLKGRGGVNYYLAISVNKGTFTAKDNVRITITHPKMEYIDPETNKPTSVIQFVDKSKRGREIMDPGSGAGLTIGSNINASAMGPTMDGRGKPELILEEYHAQFTDGTGAFGTSYSAAYFAGIVNLMKAAHPKLKQSDFLRFRSHWPTASLADGSWKFGTEVDNALAYLETPIAEALRNGIGAKYLGTKVVNDQRLFLLMKSPRSLDQFSKLPKSVQDNLSDYVLYFWVKKTPTTKIVPVEKRGQDRIITVRNAYYEYDTQRDYVHVRNKTVTVREGYWDKRYVGSAPGTYIDLSTGAIGRLDYHQLVWVPPVTRVDKVYEWQEKKVPRLVPAQTRTEPTYYKVNESVAGEPIRELKMVWIDKDAEKHPVAEHGGDLSDYATLKIFDVPEALDKKYVTDGTENDPRFFKMPASHAEVEKEIGR